MITENTFTELSLCEPLQQALRDKDYTLPSPIQAQAIPHLLKGKDLIGCAQTGTGKTAAFALPILHRLSQNPKKTGPRQIRALILTPTRELAVQIEKSFRDYGKHLHLTTTVAFGGVGYRSQIKTLERGIDILIATPGRLLDLEKQRNINLDAVEIFVLDEADRMLDMGFVTDVKRIIAKLPKKRQSLMFSATMPPAIQEMANSMLHQPTKVAVTPISSTADKIDQRVCFVERGDKHKLLIHFLKQHPEGLVLVFTRMKHGANRVAEQLIRDGIRADAIHGNKSQGARQRALENFRTGRSRVLVATDIAARGIDVKGISLVVNYDIPVEAESYVHRIGRTARAGAEGMAIAFCERAERGLLRDIERLIRQSIVVIKDHPHVEPSASCNHSQENDWRPSGNGGGNRPHRNHNQRRNGFGGRSRRRGSFTFKSRMHSPTRAASGS